MYTIESINVVQCARIHKETASDSSIRSLLSQDKAIELYTVNFVSEKTFLRY